MATNEYTRIALDYLHLTQRAYERAGEDRAYWATLGRQYGLTWPQIGHALGMTADGARALVRRHKTED